jgi:hypothetical protein
MSDESAWWGASEKSSGPDRLRQGPEPLSMAISLRSDQWLSAFPIAILIAS